jgi:hypothetical protein
MLVRLGWLHLARQIDVYIIVIAIVIITIVVMIILIIIVLIIVLTQYTHDILYDAICIYCTILYHIHTYVHNSNYCQYLIWDIIISLPAL